jgi:mRNA interferase MazF
MTFMPSYSKGNVILVRYPFSDLSASKVRPAVVVHAPHVSLDALIIPLTSRIAGLMAGEFVLQDWSTAGLHVPTAVKRGIYTVHPRLVVAALGRLVQADLNELNNSIRAWLDLP